MSRNDTDLERLRAYEIALKFSNLGMGKVRCEHCNGSGTDWSLYERMKEATKDCEYAFPFSPPRCAYCSGVGYNWLPVESPSPLEDPLDSKDSRVKANQPTQHHP